MRQKNTSDSVGKILWPCHLNVCHTRTNPKYSRIAFAMFKLLSMWTEAKDSNLKLQDKIPNFEQKKNKPPKEESTQFFGGFIFALSFSCSKPNCLAPTRHFFHSSSVTTHFIFKFCYFTLCQYLRCIPIAYAITGQTISLPSILEQKSSLMWWVHIHLVPGVKSCIKFNLSHFSFAGVLLLTLWLFIALWK